MHIEECRAAVLIDVDTGTPEAAVRPNAPRWPSTSRRRRSIARQLRLRQLGGGIVVDFVGLEGRGPRERVRQAMTGAIAGDPAQPEVLGWTRLGHLELVRPRRGRSLSDAMLEPQAAGKSAVALAFEALRRSSARPAPSRRRTGG